MKTYALILATAISFVLSLAFVSCDAGGSEPPRMDESLTAPVKEPPPKVEQGESQAVFPAVLPAYLPSGFTLDRVVKLASNTREGQPWGGAIITFSNPAGYEIMIFEADWPGTDSQFEPNAFELDLVVQDIKGVPVSVVRGGRTEVIRPTGYEEAPGAYAVWRHEGVAYTLLAMGVGWDEVEKVIASMIE